MDISRMANIPAVNQTNLTKPAESRTETKSSTLATEHTDSYIKSQAAFTPAYTKASAQKQNSDNNLLQRENTETVTKIADGEKNRTELQSQGVKHIIRAMLVKQGEVLSGKVPSVGAKLYAEELLNQIRALYNSSPAEESSEEYWQPEATADRITTFFDCVTIEGDKNDLLTRAFSGAFKETEELFGGRGRLPLESYETKQLIQENYFDKQAKSVG